LQPRQRNTFWSAAERGTVTVLSSHIICPQLGHLGDILCLNAVTLLYCTIKKFERFRAGIILQ
jgi:hypothetical protein